MLEVFIDDKDDEFHGCVKEAYLANLTLFFSDSFKNLWGYLTGFMTLLDFKVTKKGYICLVKKDLPQLLWLLF